MGRHFSNITCWLVFVGCVVAWFAKPAAAAPPELTKAEQKAMAAIKSLGGSARRLSTKDDAWDVGFQLGGRALTDDGLAHVAALKNVDSLNLRGTRITSAGLVHLKGLTTLRRLHLEQTKIDDAGTANLVGLVNLEYLNLYGTKVGDKTLARLTGLKKLGGLYVWQTKVTDEGVARLEKALPGLSIVRGLDFSNMPAMPPTKRPPPPKPTVDLKWMPVADVDAVPKSLSGANTQVIFENKSKRRVKLVWISYGQVPTYYATLAPGATRQQNTYARNTWLITDENDKPLGWFLVGTEIARAVIPGNK